MQGQNYNPYTGAPLSGIYPPVPEKTDHLSENAGFSKVTMLS